MMLSLNISRTSALSYSVVTDEDETWEKGTNFDVRNQSAKQHPNVQTLR